MTVTGKDTVDTVTYEFQPDTQEYKALVSAERLRLSPQLPDSAAAGGLHTGQQHHHIPAAKHGQPVSADRQGRLLCGAGFRREILVYAIGYLGSGKAEQLTAELQALLKSCTPVETHDDAEIGTT